MSIDIGTLNDETLMALIRDQAQKKNLKALSPYLEHRSSIIRSYVIEQLPKLAYEEDIQSLIKKGIEDESTDVRLSTLRVLDRIIRFCNETQEGLLEKEDSDKLANKFKENYFPLILELLWDSDEQIVFDTLRLLSDIGNPVAVGYMVRLYKSDNEKVIRSAQKYVNDREYGWGPVTQEALDPLVEALKDTDKRVRVGAVKYLHIAGVSAYKYIQQSLKDKSPEVRIAACQAMARIQDPIFLKDMFEMTKDDVRAVRDEARSCFVSLLNIPT